MLGYGTQFSTKNLLNSKVPVPSLLRLAIDCLVTDTDTVLHIVIDLLQPDKGTRSSCLILTENIINHEKVAFSPRQFFFTVHCQDPEKRSGTLI